MTPEVETLLNLAAQVPSEERAEFLARECSDLAARREVATMLRYADDAESFFDTAIRGVVSSARLTAKKTIVVPAGSAVQPRKAPCSSSHRAASLVYRLWSAFFALRACGKRRPHLRVDTNGGPK